MLIVTTSNPLSRMITSLQGSLVQPALGGMPNRRLSPVGHTRKCIPNTRAGVHGVELLLRGPVHEMWGIDGVLFGTAMR